MQVHSAGFTLAPLKEHELPPGISPDASPATLVTIVVKVDLGGWFAAESWLRPLVWPFRRFYFETMLNSIVSLRDEVRAPHYGLLRYNGVCSFVRVQTSSIVEDPRSHVVMTKALIGLLAA